MLLDGTNVPATFPRLVNIVQEDVVPTNRLVQTDGVLVHGKTMEDNLKDLELALE